MEEFVGKLWHRFITGKAERSHAEAAVTLEEVRSTVGILFRALGGDPGLQVQPADAIAHNARRRFMQKLAGTGTHATLAWRDGETLRLPPRIAAFPQRTRNRDLYLWLAALAAADDGRRHGEPWALRNQWLVRRTLKEFPGLTARYRALVESHIAARPAPQQLPPEEAAQELAVRQALRAPGTVEALPAARRPPHPVPLWLHPSPPACAPSPTSDTEPEGTPDSSQASEETKRRRYRAERVDMPDGEEGLLAFRMESMLTWGEYVKVDRTADDDPDDNAEKAADDMEQLSVARDAAPVAKRLRFDLDMPSAEYDDIPLEGGVLLPEWDHRKAGYLADHCRIVPMLARDATACELPPNLRRTAKRLRGQFQALAQTRVWQRGAQQGDPDIDAYLRFAADRAHGHVAPEAALYRELRTGARDLACLLLADLSLSTDAAVNDDARVIDVVRDTLFLFGEALAAAGDRFALYGFSSRKRQHVRFNLIKGFDERYDAATRGRIAAIKPGYYTRMGAAVRHGAALLAAQPAARQLLLIVTDGKPNDLDRYEGRYGVEDTRLAIIEARRQGLYPFCVTIDREAGDYLPHLFGPGHYCVIRHPEELPARLPQLYARLTA